jgi:hypothetical protein
MTGELGLDEDGTAQSHDPVGTFVGAQPQCLKCIALCATQDIGPTELRLVQGVERGVHWNNSLLRLRGRVEIATPALHRLWSEPAYFVHLKLSYLKP